MLSQAHCVHRIAQAPDDVKLVEHDLPCSFGKRLLQGIEVRHERVRLGSGANPNEFPKRQNSWLPMSVASRQWTSGRAMEPSRNWTVATALRLCHPPQRYTFSQRCSSRIADPRCSGLCILFRADDFKMHAMGSLVRWKRCCRALVPGYPTPHAQAIQ